MSGMSIAAPPSPLTEAAPPPHPLDECTNCASGQLTELFREHKVAHACLLLQEMDAREVGRELEKAFSTVEWAPSAFLLALAQWPPPASRGTFFTLTTNGCRCMRQRADRGASLPSPMARDLAGSLLLEHFEDARALTCAEFISAFQVPEDRVAEYCKRCLHSRVKAVVVLLNELKMMHLVPIEAVITAAVAQNDLDAADCFVRDNSTYQRLFIEQLVARNPRDKAIKKRLIKFGMNERDFPLYFTTKTRSSLRFLLHNRQFEDALVAVQGDLELSAYVSRFVLDKYGPENLITRLFVHRSGLVGREEFAHVDTTGVEIESFPNEDELEPEESCLSLDDLADKDCCIFVDTPESLADCVTDLKGESIVGFDCEWKATPSSLQQVEACAVLQIASASRVYVIDTIALKRQCSSLCDLFQSEDIAKLAFDANGDMSVLAKVLCVDGDPRHHVLVRNLVDVQVLAKYLNRLKRPRLDVTTPVDVPVQLEEGEIDKRHRKHDHGMAVGEATTGHAKIAGTKDENVSDCALQDEQQAADSSVSVVSKEIKNNKNKKKRGNRRSGKENSPHSASSLSLAAVAQEYLLKPLDKRSRMSDWERRPLTTAQLHYAALDALVLVAIFEVMRKQLPEEDFNRALTKITHPRAPASKSDQI